MVKADVVESTLESVLTKNTWRFPQWLEAATRCRASRPKVRIETNKKSQPVSLEVPQLRREGSKSIYLEVKFGREK